MAHRASDQLGLSDGLVHGTAGRNARLDRIAGLLDWTAVAALLSEVYASPLGRPSYPPLVLFKALLLQQWYELSDPGLEEALGDRLSFQRFCGLSLNEAVPDHSTISRLRTQVRKHGLSARLFAEIGRQIEARGLLVKQGTLIDASLIKVQVAVPPMAKGAGASSAVDADAAWTRQRGTSTFGYKAHVAVDQGSGLIRRVRLTAANIYESLVADELIAGDEAAVYADRAYEHKERRRRLKAAGIKDRIMHRSHKHQSGLPHWQARRNRLIAPIRAQVERLFGTMKRSYGYDRVRYYSLAANAVHLDLLCIAINLRRAEVLTR